MRHGERGLQTEKMSDRQSWREDCDRDKERVGQRYRGCEMQRQGQTAWRGRAQCLPHIPGTLV